MLSYLSWVVNVVINAYVIASIKFILNAVIDLKIHIVYDYAASFIMLKINSPSGTSLYYLRTSPLALI